MKILAAVDGSPYTKRMLAYLAAHDEWLGAAHEYTLLTAVNALPARAVSALDKATIKGFYDETAEKVFKPLRSFFEKQRIKASFVGKVGPAAEVIADFATKGGYDLIVMGSHGHSAIGSLVLGSVTTKVMAHCKLPVLIVR